MEASSGRDCEEDAREPIAFFYLVNRDSRLALGVLPDDVRADGTLYALPAPPEDAAGGADAARLRWALVDDMLLNEAAEAAGCALTAAPADTLRRPGARVHLAGDPKRPGYQTISRWVLDAGGRVASLDTGLLLTVGEYASNGVCQHVTMQRPCAFTNPSQLWDVRRPAPPPW